MDVVITDKTQAYKIRTKDLRLSIYLKNLQKSSITCTCHSKYYSMISNIIFIKLSSKVFIIFLHKNHHLLTIKGTIDPSLLSFRNISQQNTIIQNKNYQTATQTLLFHKQQPASKDSLNSQSDSLKIGQFIHISNLINHIYYYPIFIILIIMTSNQKQKVQMFKDRVRMEMKNIIKSQKSERITKINTLTKTQWFQPELFVELECNRISTKGQFIEMFDESSKLGEGCQSVVKKVIEKQSRKLFAVKTFKMADAQWISRMKPLFLFLRSLQCQTLMKPHYLFVSEKTQTLRVILDYIEYPSLQQILTQHKTLDLQSSKILIKILLQTVSYFHSHKACHRDIKPANILFDLNSDHTRSRFRLIDYQICKFSKNDVLQMWTSTGSLLYKAPEMFKGSYNEKVDVWSCGIIAYEILHGHPPFTHEFTHECIQSICCDPIQQKLDPSLDFSAKQFIKRCLSKDPNLRPSAEQALKEPFILQSKAGSIHTEKNARSKSLEYSSRSLKIKRSRSVEKCSSQKLGGNKHCIIHQV